ncbi:MAG TPA: type II toxin-antitoxin system death-on-curing family toxin [Candidatus Hydrogenedentes bacterium]|nr:type II toxin-antitoxin system death-on-curing family toxin [Candidatus Hydrogenedentota bacterium]
MRTLRFLTIQEVLYFHHAQMEQFGGSMGVRDPGLLESALAQPCASFGGEYLHRGLFEMAAAYLYHIVQNHPFVDGNKRVGLESALAFLALNGVEIDAPDDDLESLVLAVASGQADKTPAAAFLDKHSRFA